MKLLSRKNLFPEFLSEKYPVQVEWLAALKMLMHVYAYSIRIHDFTGVHQKHASVPLPPVLCTTNSKLKVVNWSCKTLAFKSETNVPAFCFNW
jgi:hypothetical protein